MGVQGAVSIHDDVHLEDSLLLRALATGTWNARANSFMEVHSLRAGIYKHVFAT